MTENEMIKVLLLGDVTKILNLEEEKMKSNSDLCILLCSSKDLDAFIKNAISKDLETPEIKLISAKLLECVKKSLKEE